MAYRAAAAASRTAFQNPEVTFVNLNLANVDATKHAGVPVVGDARMTIAALDAALDGYQVPAELVEAYTKHNTEWAQYATYQERKATRRPFL